MVQVYRYHRIIHQWSTLPVVSVLGANVLRGPNQIPWDGKLEYDYQLWIDSDIVFNSEKFFQLILDANPEGEKEREIVAGWYCTEDGKNNIGGTLVGGR